MWQKGWALLVGLVAVMGFGWVSAQEPGDGGIVGASYVLKTGDHVKWPSGHSWYFWMTSTNSYPLKVVTTNASGKAIYAKAPAGGCAVYADGRVKAKSFRYMTPQTHYLTVPAEEFHPLQNMAYQLGGGAYVIGGDCYLVAAVHLPQGAVIKGFRVNYYDASTAKDLMVVLGTVDNVSSGFTPIWGLLSSGSGGLGSMEKTGLSTVVDNTLNGYSVRAGIYWDGDNLRIDSAVITYTTAEPE